MGVTRREFLASAALLGALGMASRVSLSRRLLLAAGGGSSFPAPSAFAGFALAAAPDGGWCWFSDPRAVSYGGYTYVGYLNSSGDVRVMVVEEATGTVANDVALHAAFEVDDHDNPGLYVRVSDHKLMAFYSKHLGTNTCRQISTASLDSDPTLSSGFTGETTATYGEAGGTLLTYANPVYQSDQDGSGAVLTLFYRGHLGGTAAGWHYAQSNDDGATWGSGVRLHDLTYSRVVSNGVDRIDVCATRHPNGEDGDPKGLYHLYRNAAAWKKTDGTTITDPVPIDAANMTEVYNDGANPVWIWDICYDGSGHPVIAFSVYPSTSDHRYWYARWDGSAWNTYQIAAGGGTIETAMISGGTSQPFYSGGMALDHDNANVVWCSVGLGSDLWEVRRYVTADGGATWGYSVVSRSGGKNCRPYGVRDHSDAIQAVYWRGTFTNYIDFDLGTDGTGT